MPSVQQIMMSFPTVTSVVIGPSGRAAQAAAGRNGCRGARFKFFLLLADSAWTRTDSESRPTRTTVAPSAAARPPLGHDGGLSVQCSDTSSRSGLSGAGASDGGSLRPGS